MTFIPNIAVRRWLSVFLMFGAGALPGIMDGKPAQAIMTHGTILGLFALGLMSLPLLFRQEDGREPSLLTKLEYAFANCLLVLAVVVGNGFDVSDADYRARLFKVIILLGAAGLCWCGYIVWRHRHPH